MPKMMCQATDPPHPPNYQDPECYYDKNGSKSCPVSLSHVESSEDHKYRASQTPSCNSTPTERSLIVADRRLVAENDVFVFDTKLNKFGRATASSTSEPCLLPAGCGPFPLNANLPQVNLRGDKVFVVGGEVDERTICGELYQHCA